MDDATGFPLAGLNQESESKKAMYLPNRGTNEQGGKKTKKRRRLQTRPGDENSGDREYTVGAPLDLGGIDQSAWSAAEESVSFWIQMSVNPSLVPGCLFPAEEEDGLAQERCATRKS
jgi:hypothetical protein